MVNTDRAEARLPKHTGAVGQSCACTMLGLRTISLVSSERAEADPSLVQSIPHGWKTQTQMARLPCVCTMFSLHPIRFIVRIAGDARSRGGCRSARARRGPQIAQLVSCRRSLEGCAGGALCEKLRCLCMMSRTEHGHAVVGAWV